jgi:F-type H+-transporting ATPase subunit b
MLDPNPGLIVWTIVSFILLVLVLRRLAWKPILEALHKREESIRNTLDRAEQARAEAANLLEENRKQLERAEEEGRRILTESRKFGEKLKEEIVESANQQSRRMVDQAKQEIERDKDAALAQLRSEVASLAISAAEKILDETLDENRHRKIVDSYLKELPKN